MGDSIQINLGVLRELAPNDTHLFADTAQIVLKETDDLTALVKNRIAEHREREAKRIEAEREKIRQEEIDKLAREAETKAAATQVGQENSSRLRNSDGPSTGPLPPVLALAAAPIPSIARLRDMLAEQMIGMTQGELQQLVEAARAIRTRRAA